jgi:hypothetical protein
MTFSEHIAEQGVELPIEGFEDLLFDYLQALYDKGYDIPVDDIMEALYATQCLAPLCQDLKFKENMYVH